MNAKLSNSFKITKRKARFENTLFVKAIVFKIRHPDMKLLKQIGKLPNKERKAYFNTLSNYSKGKFQNTIHTPALREGENPVHILWNFIKKQPHTSPTQLIPFVETDLKNLSTHDNIFIWFGHSSYFIQLDGKRFLIDPVFSGNVSPIPHSAVHFPGSNRYQAEDIPFIDVLLISHDHWDHLDYTTVEKLKHKVSKVVCGLGVAQHFEYWGWNKEKLVEKNWYETFTLDAHTRITLTPTRHFSGRLFKRNTSLWTSFVLQSRSKCLFLGGDSGYGPHFKEIGKKFGPFDAAVLECGQYSDKWPYIHSQPHEVVQEVNDLGAKYLILVHHSKFRLAKHPWNEPLNLVSELAKGQNIPIATPRIGEIVDLNTPDSI